MRFTIYNAEGSKIGATKYAEDAAVLVSAQGEGATVRCHGSRVVWTEGADGSAGESYDAAATTMYDREMAFAG